MPGRPEDMVFLGRVNKVLAVTDSDGIVVHVEGPHVPEKAAKRVNEQFDLLGRAAKAGGEVHVLDCRRCYDTGFVPPRPQPMVMPEIGKPLPEPKTMSG